MGRQFVQGLNALGVPLVSSRMAALHSWCDAVRCSLAKTLTTLPAPWWVVDIVGLTWDRIDVKRGFITLRALDTKTKTARQVPMTPDVKVTLQRLAKVRSPPTAAAESALRHVFTYEGRPLQRVSRSFKTALKDAGITDFRFHDLPTAPQRTYEGQGWTRQQP